MINLFSALTKKTHKNECIVSFLLDEVSFQLDNNNNWLYLWCLSGRYDGVTNDSSGKWCLDFRAGCNGFCLLIVFLPRPPVTEICSYGGNQGQLQQTRPGNHHGQSTFFITNCQLHLIVSPLEILLSSQSPNTYKSTTPRDQDSLSKVLV